MRHLLTVERFKIVRSKIFYGILACLGVFMFFFVIGLHADHPPMGAQGMFTPARFDILLTVWFPLFIAYFVAMEFQHKTINDALCLGKTRVQVYLAKLFFVLCAVAVMVLAIMVGTTLGLTIRFGFGEVEGLFYVRHFLQALVLQTFFQFGVAALFLMIAFMVRTPTMTVILGVGYTLGTWFAGQMLRNLLFGGRFAFLTEFLPGLFHMDAITRNDTGGIIYGGIVSILWIVATTFIGCMVFKRTDLK